ncbi:MAG TPA: hypothetical protein VKP88_03155 [Candidatus Paceibacterota bacterium]|nr:hypothetical protein [Candidatus Paceibacterota bacterium]
MPFEFPKYERREDGENPLHQLVKDFKESTDIDERKELAKGIITLLKDEPDLSVENDEYQEGFERFGILKSDWDEIVILARMADIRFGEEEEEEDEEL